MSGGNGLERSASRESVVLEVNEGGPEDVVVDIGEPTTVTKTTKVAPDGGHGWVVAATCFVISFFTVGYSKTFVPLVLKEYADADKSELAWIKAAPTSIPLVLAPLSGLFLGRFGHRATFALGYFLCVMAMCLGFLSTSAGAMTRTLSCLLGVGLALGTCATVDCLKKHFVANRPTAMTVNAVGGILGGIVAPFWVKSSVSAISVHYTWLVWIVLFMIFFLYGLRVFGDPEDHFVSVTKEVPIEDTTEVSEEVMEQPVSRAVRCYRFVYELMGIGFLADPRFVLALLICTGTALGNSIPTGSVGKQAKVLGVEDALPVGIALFAGLGQLVSATFYGLFNRRSPLARNTEYFIALVLSTLFAAFPFGCDAYWQLALVGFGGGMCTGVMKSLPTLLLIENHGAGNLVSTLNLTKMVEGLTKMAYPSVAAQFVDGSAEGRFNVGAFGLAAMLGGVLHMLC